MISAVVITPEMLERIHVHAVRKIHGTASEHEARPNMHAGGEGNLRAACGEIAVADYSGAEISNTYGHDMLLCGFETDCKTQGQKIPTAPSLDWRVNVSAIQRAQPCEAYVFARVLTTDYSMVWICGWIPKEEFFRVASFTRKGEIAEPRNGFVAREDLYHAPISALSSVPKKEGSPR